MKTPEEECGKSEEWQIKKRLIILLQSSRMSYVSITGLGSQDIFRHVFPLTTSRRVYRCISWLNTSQLPLRSWDPAEESERPGRWREKERRAPLAGGGNHSAGAYFKDSWFIHVLSMNKWAAAVNAARYWSPGGFKPTPYINRATFRSAGGRRSTGGGGVSSAAWSHFNAFQGVIFFLLDWFCFLSSSKVSLNFLWRFGHVSVHLKG